MPCQLVTCCRSRNGRVKVYRECTTYTSITVPAAVAGHMELLLAAMVLAGGRGAAEAGRLRGEGRISSSCTKLTISSHI